MLNQTVSPPTKWKQKLFNQYRREDAAKATTSDALYKILSSAVATYKSPEIALLHVIDKYNFRLSTLQYALEDMGLDVNFSKVKYKDIAALVGLDRFGNPEDIETFELHRSRIPTLFRFIIEDMDPMLMQYGHLSDHITEEATSRFMSPILNHLIAQFGFKFRNLPESIIKGRLPTRGRMQYYFRAFGRISILVVEAKFEIRNIPARFDTIAQVIAECDACDWNNSMNNFGLPVFGILWGGVAVQFFKYDGTMKAYPFFRGAFSGDPLPLQNGIVLPDSALAESTLPFILTRRQISETVFDLLLRGYIASLEAYRDGPATTANRRGSLDKWDEALESARCALSRFRDAESKRQRSDKAGASQAVLQAQEALNHSGNSPNFPQEKQAHHVCLAGRYC